MARHLRLEDYADDEERQPFPEPDPASIAARCRQARRVRPGLAPGTVGRVAQLTGGHYHRIERGTKVPTILVVAKIVGALVTLGVDVTAEWLAFNTGRGPRKVRKKPAPKPATAEAEPAALEHE